MANTIQNPSAPETAPGVYRVPEMPGEAPVLSMSPESQTFPQNSQSVEASPDQFARDGRIIDIDAAALAVGAAEQVVQDAREALNLALDGAKVIASPTPEVAAAPQMSPAEAAQEAATFEKGAWHRAGLISRNTVELRGRAVARIRRDSLGLVA